VVNVSAGQGEWKVADYEQAIKSESLCATATAAAAAIATPNKCLASGVVYADVGPGTCPPP
jgi:hypothetical protein